MGLGLGKSDMVFFIQGTAEKDVAESQGWELSGMRQTGMSMRMGVLGLTGGTGVHQENRGSVSGEKD